MSHAAYSENNVCEEEIDQRTQNLLLLRLTQVGEPFSNTCIHIQSHENGELRGLKMDGQVK